MCVRKVWRESYRSVCSDRAGFEINGGGGEPLGSVMQAGVVLRRGTVLCMANFDGAESWATAAVWQYLIVSVEGRWFAYGLRRWHPGTGEGVPLAQRRSGRTSGDQSGHGEPRLQRARALAKSKRDRRVGVDFEHSFATDAGDAE